MWPFRQAPTWRAAVSRRTAGTHDFVFPGTEQRAGITFHQAGTYAAVCLNGGEFYVIFEFSMPQPMGWFDKFQSTFPQYVAR